MAKVISAYDHYAKGQRAEWDKNESGLRAPIQMLPRSQKDIAWQQANLNWWEHIGLNLVRTKAKRYLKNYNLAKGVIDKEDYILGESDYSDMIDVLTKETESPLELRFFPIIPNVVNLLTGEFSKRNTKVLVKAIDDFTINEMLDSKYQMMSELVVSRARQIIEAKLAASGIDTSTEEGQQELENQTMSLPQIQEFFNKSYRSTAERWATHELAVAEQRFKLSELEDTAFRDSLICDQEFWHIGLGEDDYFVELWNPINTFYHKSPDVRYVSQGNYVGRILLMSIGDVIDRYGYLMTDTQIKQLERVQSPHYHIDSIRSTATYSPQEFYDTRRSPSDQNKSIHWSQAVSMRHLFEEGTDTTSLLGWLNEDADIFSQGMLRVTEVYWKSQKKIGYLTEVLEDGTRFQDIVSEDFIVINEPKYDLSLNKKKTPETLIEGQHIEWLWVNEVWKGIKIGMNHSTGFVTQNESFDPIYLDVKPLPFQFKGDNSIFGAKLPVEGCAFSSRVGKTTSLVEQMSPFQIGFNFANNQVIDMLFDEIGNVLLFDQNMLPRVSMDGSWGKHNFIKAWQVMKNLQIMPLDTSITNTEAPLNFQHTQVVPLEKTNQLLSRIKIAEYFKNEAFATVGITPQRVGSVTSSESATGVQTAVNNSYAQTEIYFTQHSNFLMPRVKEMILNAAQFINVNKPNIRIAYMNRAEENVFFEIEGTKLLLADLQIFCTADPNFRNILEQLKQLAINNNTTTATIYDLAKIVESDSISEILDTLKGSVKKMEQEQNAQRESQERMQKEMLEAQAAEKESERQFTAEQKELDRATQRYIADVRAVGMSGEADLNANRVQDALEVERTYADIEDRAAANEQKRQEANNKIAADLTKSMMEQASKAKELKLKEEELQVQRENMKNDLQIEKIRAKNRAKPKSK
jgi:hypothetical protein